jgi:hypothetical protein
METINMDKKNLFLNIAITVAAVLVILVALFKFILPNKPASSFQLNNPEQIEVQDFMENKLPLSGVIDKEKLTYIFIFEITDCGTCLFKGMEDMMRLKKAGNPCLAIAVHDLLDELRGWSAHYEFTPFYMLKKTDFYQHIQAAGTPVIAKIKHKKVVGYRYIVP